MTRLWPPPDNVSLREKLISGLTALVAMAAVVLVSGHFLDPVGIPPVVASMGATAVLLFAVPSGPLSQPWAVWGGHLISAAIGVSCARWIADPVAAAALAVGLAISVMYLCRCLHPPGGASALTAVLGGPEVSRLGYEFLLTPLALNLVIIFSAALILNNLFPKRRYPARPSPKPKHGNAQRRLLEDALHRLDTFVDVSVEELEQICHLARQAQDRLFGDTTCADVMTREVITADYDTPTVKLWEWMVTHHIRSVPVVDRRGFVLGIVTTHDLLRQVTHQSGASWRQRLHRFLTPSDTLETDKPEVAGHLMTKPVVTARQDQPLTEVLPLFSEHGYHHLPIVDDHGRLVGILSEHDLVQLLDMALMRLNARQPPEAC
ncbi:CBS domain-containing membrane protein [Methylomarinovum tepidoasis]|uniref:CBS domain-containing membrane protein n=1 Tax=Methylomarinovum tepidoasis TaxID=2840183 RepID=A0AAU9C772_9GAMM|nr:HPP family protein [Methylomarinovum sp. IN45]BCX87656.1 CBS domain-containing membrane protein [Methylomarinovum sp. IN45]